MANQGNEVVLLVSSFDHYGKKYRNEEKIRDYEREYSIGLKFVPSIAYQKNVSLRRIANYAVQAVYLDLFRAV